MSAANEPSDQWFQDELQKRWASQSIEMQFWEWPEFRLELVNGQFLVGGTLEGSRWLLKEALQGWGLEAAIAFAPVEQWWEALRLAYGVSWQSEEEWLLWAESLPLASAEREGALPLLGSQYTGEHRWVRDHLRQALMVAVGRARLGTCAGPNYGLQLGQDVLTPDILMVTAEQLATGCFHDYYVEIPAHLVIEVCLPERRGLDDQDRRRLYEQGQVPHYWVVDPVGREFTFWRWTPEGYQPGRLDGDGCYRGVEHLSFSPEIFWLSFDEQVSPYNQRLAAFTSEPQPREWGLRQEPGAELGYGSLPFRPQVELEPRPITVEEFMSWCPETKLEGPPFPLVGGETGTRNAIADKRRNDLMVYLTFTHFGKRPKFKDFSPTVQADIKVLSVSYQQACTASDLMLMSLGQNSMIEELCRLSPIGQHGECGSSASWSMGQNCEGTEWCGVKMRMNT